MTDYSNVQPDVQRGLSNLPEPDGVKTRPEPSVGVGAVCTWCEYCRWPSKGAGNSCGLPAETATTNGQIHSQLNCKKLG